MVTSVCNRKKQLKVSKLFNDSLLIELYKTPVEYGSLLLPVQKTTQQAKIIKVSNDLANKFAPGENVIVDPLRGTPVGNYVIYKATEVLAKIE